MTNKKTLESAAHQAFLVATIRPWNIDAFHSVIKHFNGDWHLVSEETALTTELVHKLKPRYIFFPHWSQKVPEQIFKNFECVCFHETDVPYGRGGSPIQNLIARGHTDTVITALQMEKQLDSGPVYMKRPLSLKGNAEEIFARASTTIAAMIGDIARDQPAPTAQEGVPTVFKRLTPDQSEITARIEDIHEMYNHIRMLDAREYPRAYLDIGNYRFTFSNAQCHTNSIDATVRITKRNPHD